MDILRLRSQKRPAVLLLAIMSWLISATTYSQESQYSAEVKVIKEIRLEGLKRTKEYIVTRELISKVGDPLRQENLDREKNRLELLDIFSDIRIDKEVIGNEVILTYIFVETFPILPSIGLKISDENGVSIGGGVKTPNLLGRDIFFSGRLMFGGSKDVEVWIENPWITGNHLGYSLEYYHRERDNLITESYEIANEFYLSVGSYLGENGRVGGDFSSINIKTDKPSMTLSPDGKDHTSRLGFHLGYDSRDVVPDTRRGWWNEIAFSWDMRLFKNSSKFVQVDLDIRRFQPLPFWDRHNLAFFSLTTLRTGTVGEDVAPWQVFGIGGTNTVRGWEFAARKGKNQFINTLEYRITLLKPRMVHLPFKIKYRGGVAFAVFGDLGIGWDTQDQFKAENFIGGVGAGIRLLLPIVGMLRMDVGWGQQGKSVLLHIGAYEKPVMTRRRVR
jgi:outer membrane protein insertion porin family